MDDVLLMAKCEQKKLFKRDGVRSYQWTEVAVATLPMEAEANREIRCLYCHGKVRIHAEDGRPEHVEHRSKKDSEHCKAGRHFKGEHRLSASPVE